MLSRKRYHYCQKETKTEKLNEPNSAANQTGPEPIANTKEKKTEVVKTSYPYQDFPQVKKSCVRIANALQSMHQ